MRRAPHSFSETVATAVATGVGRLSQGALTPRPSASASLSFAWAGGLAPGDRHYYCVRAPDFLIEYDNTQDDGNHAHSVWRHVRHDWGTDLLRGHYTEQHF